MKKILLGNTGLSVTKTSLGCLPLQRRSREDAVALLRAAYEGGVNFYDTANAYTDSEEKIGLALSDVRKNIVIATKSGAPDRATVAAHIDNSLAMMKTDYIDLFQFHNIPELPDRNDPEGPWAAALAAKARGKIRHIGATAHKIGVAEAIIASGEYETLQYPISYLSSDRELALMDKCQKAGMGFIVMKGLAGGLLATSPRACHAFMKDLPGVNIWGAQSLAELNQWLELAREDPSLDDELRALIAKDRAEFSGAFCRSCGYCMPCAVGIEIYNCARMNMLLRRSPWRKFCTPEWQEKMEKIADCIHCGACKSRCPYGLDIPNILAYMLEDYRAFYDAHKAEL